MKITLSASVATVAALSFAGANAQVPDGAMTATALYGQVLMPMSITNDLCTSLGPVFSENSGYGLADSFAAPGTPNGAYNSTTKAAEYDLYIAYSAPNAAVTGQVISCGTAYAFPEFTDCAIANVTGIMAAQADGPDLLEAFNATINTIDISDQAALIGNLAPLFTPEGSAAMGTLASLLVEGDFVEAALRKLACNRIIEDFQDVITPIQQYYGYVRLLAPGLPEVFPWDTTTPTVECIPSVIPAPFTFQAVLDMIPDEPESEVEIPRTILADLFYAQCVAGPGTASPTTSAPSASPTTSAPTTATQAPTTATQAPTPEPLPVLPFDLLALDFAGQHATEINAIIAAILNEDLGLPSIVASFLFPYASDQCAVVSGADTLNVAPCMALSATAVPELLQMVADLMYDDSSLGGVNAACTSLVQNIPGLEYLAFAKAQALGAYTGSDAAEISANIDTAIAIVTGFPVGGVVGMVGQTLGAAAVTCNTPPTAPPTLPPSTAAPTSASNVVTASAAALLAAIALM